MRRKKTSYIYAVACSDYKSVKSDGACPIKVGVSNNPKKRLGELQVANHQPLLLVAALGNLGVQTEASIHSALHDCHISGEWYMAQPSQVCQLIAREWGRRFPSEQIDTFEDFTYADPFLLLLQESTTNLKERS